MNAKRPDPIFVGEDLAIDFLNSVATPAGETIEWLATGEDLIAWLEDASALPGDGAARLRASSTAASLDGIASRARDLREWFREFVRRRAGGDLRARDVRTLAPLNVVLSGDSAYLAIVAGGADGELRLATLRKWERPDSLLLPIAEAMAHLVCAKGLTHVRHCEGEGCTLWFLDTSKAHRRRWCSMAACGNRAKAAAFRSRETEADGDR